MANSKKAATEATSQPSRPKIEQVAVTENASDLAGTQEILTRPVPNAVEGGDHQAAHLGDPRLQSAQREAFAHKIGSQYGNQHLQRLLTADRGKTDLSSGKNGYNGKNGKTNFTKSTKGIDKQSEGTNEGEESIDEIGNAGTPSFLPVDPPLDGKNGVVQREEASTEDDKPTEAEKAAALAAASAAKGQAGQAQSKSEQGKGKAKAASSAEKQAKQTAKQKGDSAQAEGKSKPKGAPEGQSAPEVKQGKVSPNGTSPQAGAGGIAQAPAAGVNGKKAPASPQEDPGFRAATGKIKQVGRKQKSHEPAKKKSDAAQAAAEAPANEVTSKAQAGQVGELEATETPDFDKAAFKAKLMQRIEAMSPKSAEEADSFKSSNKAGAIKGEMTGEVDQKKAASQGPLEEKAAAPPDPSGIESKQVTAMTPETAGAPPPKVGAEAAVPKKKGQAELETPLKEQSQSLDDKMADADITDEQLAKSNEPEFVQALDAKKEAQTHAQEAPQGYREFEEGQISQAQSEASETAHAQTQGMHGDRATQLAEIAGEQSQAKSEDEQKRAKVAADIQKIYDSTKTKVDGILSKMDQEVSQTFDSGAEAAKQAFEDYIDSETEAYKQERYGGWLGWAKWIKDKFKSDPEINRIAQRGKQIFIQEMDAVIDNVVEIIARGLAEAKAEIATGKKEIQAYVDKLPQDLQKVGQEAAGDIQDKFEMLEANVDSKQDELIDSLASKYMENLEAVNARVKEIEEANKGLIDKAVDFVDGVIQTIKKLKSMLTSVLAKAASVIGKIIKDPIGFLGNLISGISQGLNNFLGNIMTHLQAGLVGWLTGSLGSVGISISGDIFSLEGMFSLVMQVLGLSWDYIRGKAVKLLGEPMVAVLEKGFEVFQILINEGPSGLWQYVKDQLSDLKSMVLDEIKRIVVEQVIKAGIKWILGLMSPAGALVKAAMAIYDIIMFFIDRGSQIMELVTAVVDSVAAVVSGNVGAMAAKIEQALAKAIPVAISFLASLLGLGNIAKKVQQVIQRVRKKIDRAIDKLIMKAKKAGKKLLRKLGIGKGEKSGEAGDEDEDDVIIKVKKDLEPKLSSVKGVGEVRPVITSTFNKFKNDGLKSLDVVEDPKKPGEFKVKASASPEEDVAAFSTTLGIEVGDLLPLVGGSGWGKTTLSAYMIVGETTVNLGKHENTREEDLHNVDRHAEKQLLRSLESEWDDVAAKGKEIQIVLEITRSPCGDCMLVLRQFVDQKKAEGYNVSLTVRTLSLYGGTKKGEEEGERAMKYEGTRIALTDIKKPILELEAWDIFAILEERGIKIDENVMTAKQQNKLKNRIDEVKKVLAQIEEVESGG